MFVGDSYALNWGRLALAVDKKYDVFNLRYIGCNLTFHNGLAEAFDLDPRDRDRCNTLTHLLNKKSFVKDVKALVLVSHRPFNYDKNLFRFEILSWIQNFSPEVEIFIMGNYFQLDRFKFEGCLELMFSRSKTDASVCIENSGFFNPIEEVRQLAKKDFDQPDLNYRYVSLFELMKHDGEIYPYEFNGVPYMKDWNHLTKAFIELISNTLIEYDGDDSDIKALRKFFQKH